MEALVKFLIFGAFVVIALVTLAKMFKFGGLKGAMYSAPITGSVGKVSGSGPKTMSMSVKVHRLGGGPSRKAVGLEFVAKSFASYQSLPVALSETEARQLVQLIQRAYGGDMST